MLEMEAAPPLQQPKPSGPGASGAPGARAAYRRAAGPLTGMAPARSLLFHGVRGAAALDASLPASIPQKTGPSVPNSSWLGSESRAAVRSASTHELLDDVVACLRCLQDPDTTDDIPDAWADPELVDLMRVLEELKSAAAAVQARAAASFDASQRRAQSRAGVPAEHL
ncbi:hypothetical protein LJ757_07165, partial [Arthrobacter sp. zg-Y453]|nr:hypothetical protein [Arthrobacter caoxuetaonis]